MDYAGTIAVDLTGGDTDPVTKKTIFERTTCWTLEAARDFPDTQFYVSGPGDKIYDIPFPGNVQRIAHPPEKNSLDRILAHIDKLRIQAVVTHEKAKTMQKILAEYVGDETNLRKLGGLRRTALVAVIPTAQRQRYVLALDVGANHWNKTVDMEQYAHLGTIISRHLFGLTQPKVSIFNMGEESDAGPPEYQELYKKLEKDSRINFVGFTESRHILDLVLHKYQDVASTPDVVLFEGFTGNEFIKVLQDAVKLLLVVAEQEAFYRPVPVASDIFNWARYGATISLNAGPIHRTEKRLNPKRYGGALFAGVRTAEGRDVVIVKGHGEANRGIYYGIKRAKELNEQKIIAKINSELEEVLLKTDTVISMERRRIEENKNNKAYAPNQI